MQLFVTRTFFASVSASFIINNQILYGSTRIVILFSFQ